MASNAGSFFRYGTSFSRFSSGSLTAPQVPDSPSPCTGQELRTGVGSYRSHGTASDVPGSRSMPSRSWSLRNSHPDGWNDRPLLCRKVQNRRNLFRRVRSCRVPCHRSVVASRADSAAFIENSTEADSGPSEGLRRIFPPATSSIYP